MRVTIDTERLWQALMTLAEVGAYDDEATGLRGVNRLALTDADAAGRRLVKSWFEDAGLEVRVDQIGNVIGRRAGRDPNAAPVMTGSHIDSVPTGGAFDGSLGVIGALEVVRALNDAKHETERPIEIAFFTDEEGARFKTDMLGSAVAAGRLELGHALGLADVDGQTVGAELNRIGFRGDASPALSPYAYLEVHIEQGPVLATAGVDLGVVTGVQGISWQQLTLTGRSAHAGTTPMALRKDAGLAMAKIAVQMNAMVASGHYGANFRATMGFMELSPNRVNIVASKAICTVDLRTPDDDAMTRAEADLATYCKKLETELGVQITAQQTAKTPYVAFDPSVQDLLAKKMNARGFTHQRILSGAGHDAQELAARCPTAMIFVPGAYDGISHNPREYSSPEACGKGVQVLLDTLIDLAS